MEFENKKLWRKKSSLVKRRDGYECQRCRRYGRHVAAEHVHHILPIEYYPEYRMENWNLISLCRNCHNAMHDRESHELTEEGNKLARETARRQGIPWMR